MPAEDGFFAAKLLFLTFSYFLMPPPVLRSWLLIEAEMALFLSCPWMLDEAII